MIILNVLLYHFFLIPVSMLPFRVMYLLSDFLFLVLYRIAGYRKKVVMQNISRSFPQKKLAEQQQIAAAFYSHLCDLVVESIKIFTISEKQVLKRMTCRNPEVMNKYFDENRSVILAGGHYNNWELFAVAVHEFIKHKPVGIYKPLSNLFFDKKMRETRGKFGLEMLSTKDVKSFFETGSKELTATIFAIDQSPGNAKSAYWMEFLNQDTAVLFGMEKYAVEYNQPVIFGRLKKLKRGHYELEFEEITAAPAEMPYGRITEKATALLAADIIRTPEFWLWSHKRWKRKREEAEAAPKMLNKT